MIYEKTYLWSGTHLCSLRNLVTWFLFTCEIFSKIFKSWHEVYRKGRSTHIEDIFTSIFLILFVVIAQLIAFEVVRQFLKFARRRRRWIQLCKIKKKKNIQIYWQLFDQSTAHILFNRNIYVHTIQISIWRTASISSIKFSNIMTP